MNREMLKVAAVSGVVSLAVSFGMWHAVPVTQAAQARSAETRLGVTAPGNAVAGEPRLSRTERTGDSSPIREAYSDGGYQDWVEHQAAKP
jgi:hypothetical protein